MNEMNYRKQETRNTQKGSAAKRWLRRAACMALAAAMLWQPGNYEYALAQKTYADEAADKAAIDWKAEAGMVEMIEWNRQKDDAYMPKDNNTDRYLFLAWNSGATGWNYFHSGAHMQREQTWKYDDDDESSVAIASCKRFASSNSECARIQKMFPQGTNISQFYTLGSHGMPKLIYADKDGDNNDNVQYYILTSDVTFKRSNGEYWYDFYLSYDGNDNFRLSSGKEIKWGFADYEGKYNKDHKEKFVIYSNLKKQRDLLWYYCGNNFEVYQTSSFAGDSFYVWVGTPVKKTAITKNYTVRSGQVLNIDGNVVIMDGVKITVEPGGVLSVSGELMNNGKIENYGTVVLMEKAKMYCFDPVNDYAGQITCYGSTTKYLVYDNYTYRQTDKGEGKLIVMKNALLAFSRDYGDLRLCNNSYLLNYGTIVSPTMKADDSVVENRGNMALGYKTAGLNFLGTTTASVGAGGKINFSGGMYLSGNSAVNSWRETKLINYGNLMGRVDESNLSSTYGGDYQKRENGRYYQYNFAS